MVHGLAAQLGGAVHLASQAGVGTNVELWLPRTSEQSGASETSSAAVTGERVSGTIVLVDDEDVARSTTAEMLAEMGFEVTQFTSAEEALAHLRDGFVPDLLISDHLMPGMSGEDLAHEVEALYPAMKVLIISGFADLEGISPKIPRLNKPFRHQQLSAAIDQLLGDRRATFDALSDVSGDEQAG